MERESLFCTIQKKRWEITDDAVKHNTVLMELRFAGPERNFRVKIEISTREKELKTTVLLLRGVPVQTLEPTLLMTEKKPIASARLGINPWHDCNH